MAPRTRPRWLWLAAAALLLLAGAWLMFSTEPAIAPEPRQVNLPTRMTPSESRRGEARRTVVWRPALDDAGFPLGAAPRPGDPLMAIMPTEVKRGAVVAEFNAIVNSDVGQALVQCLFGGEDDVLGQLKDAGLDPRTSLDRVAFIDDAVVLTGQFQGGGWTRLVPGAAPAVSGRGKQGQVYEWTRPDGGVVSVGSWGDQMLVLGQDRAGVLAALDRLEASGPRPAAVLSEDQAYGEVYGVLAPAALADLVGREDAALGQTLRDSARSVRLHADVSHDVGLVADFQGADEGKTEDLRRALGGALSLGRMQAQARGREEEAQLLDGARVTRSDDGQFRLQAGLPYEYLSRVFKDCVARRRARQADAGP
jgi:hypothetical protein